MGQNFLFLQNSICAWSNMITFLWFMCCPEISYIASILLSQTEIFLCGDVAQLLHHVVDSFCNLDGEKKNKC